MMAQSRVYLDLTFISLLQRIEPAQETALPESIVENLRTTVAKGRQVYRSAKHSGVPIASQLREFEMRIDLTTPRISFGPSRG